MLQMIQEELFAVESQEEMDVFKRIFAPLKPSLAAVKNQKHSAFIPVASCSTSTNKHIEPQKRLFTTKKSRTKESSERPSADELNTLAVQLLYREEGE